LPGFLRNIDTYKGEPRTRLALRLVTLTFVRTTELRAARWDEFEDASGHPYDWNSDIPPAQWRIPAARMKRRLEYIVPLSRQAVAALRELRPLAGNSDHLFPSPSKGGIMSQNTLLFALYRMGYRGLATTHGFRGVASTMLNESGRFNSDWIEAQLAHVEGNKVRAAYNAAQWMNERRGIMQWWADTLDSLRHENGNVVALRAG
jgi:integrase